MVNYQDPEIEKMARKEIEALQSGLAKRVCSHSWKRSPFYRRHWSGSYPGEISDLPFLTKQDLVDTFPFDLCTVPVEDLVYMSLTSGSTGRPTAILKSREDMETASLFSVRKMVMRGVRKTDVFQMTLSYGLWSAGMGAHAAAQKLGCLVIPSGPGNTKRQVWLMQNFGTTVLHAAPSYHLRIAEVGEQMGVDFESLSLRIAVSAAGRLDQGTREKIEERLNVSARNTYGMSEVGGVATECEFGCGLHSCEDELLLEVIDPETGETVGEGERGELVVTSLRRFAMPIIRYRTRDMVKVLSKEPCECGRTHLRLSGDIERIDESVKIRGVLVNPGAIERYIDRYPELTGNFLVQVRHGARPGLLCELKPTIETAFLSETTGSIVEELKGRIGLTFDVSLLPYGEMPVEREGKRVQVMASQHRS
jgi:phenylacetate-CoA ligase